MSVFVNHIGVNIAAFRGGHPAEPARPYYFIWGENRPEVNNGHNHYDRCRFSCLPLNLAIVFTEKKYPKTNLSVDMSIYDWD